MTFCWPWIGFLTTYYIRYLKWGGKKWLHIFFTENILILVICLESCQKTVSHFKIWSNGKHASPCRLSRIRRYYYANHVILLYYYPRSKCLITKTFKQITGTYNFPGKKKYVIGCRLLLFCAMESCLGSVAS